MRLAVFDGAVGPEEIRQTVAALGDKERVTVVAKVVLPGAEETLGELARGSRIRKAPRDLLSSGAKRARRRAERIGLVSVPYDEALVEQVSYTLDLRRPNQEALERARARSGLRC
ncbi:MAG: hypothetical protein WKF73_17675 [Nocardioidaceae bacterium]